MRRCVWSFFAFLVVHAAHSYILLTANLDDVDSMAKQLAESPVVDQIKTIWSRAYSRFNEKVGDSKIRNRAEDINISELITNVVKQVASSPLVEQVLDVWRRAYDHIKDLAANTTEKTAAGSESEYESRVQRRQGLRNESFYLKSIKKILDDV